MFEDDLSLPFSREFLSIMEGYDPLKTHYADSAALLRRMTRDGPLKIFDISNRPELFFLAHRLLAQSMCGGFGIRYTVHYNLFAGSVIGLGTDEQAKLLYDIEKRQQLGCFALTERSAGVLSGLIVETTAEYVPEEGAFVINTPNDGAAKNWISQGLTAEWVVIIASLKLNGINRGPHAFLARMRDDTGHLAEGISVTDMGSKTVANDLDNARITFHNFKVPSDALLARYCYVDKNGKYVQRGKERMRIEVIGQRLLTGRLAIAEMACDGVMKLIMETKSYTDSKMIHYAPGKEMPMSRLPQLQRVYKETHERLGRMRKYSTLVEAKLCECLRVNAVPDRKLVDEIAVAKIKALEVATDVGHKVEQEVGSYVLMGGSGFEHKDILLCCKFAEGDSRILQQKLVRDYLKHVQSMSWPARIGSLTLGSSSQRGCMAAALKLAAALSSAQGGASKISLRHGTGSMNLCTIFVI